MIHLVQFGTSEHDSFRSVRDFRAQSAIHLVQFGSSERDSFGSVRDFSARFIRFSSGLQSAERNSFGSVRDFRAQFCFLSQCRIYINKNIYLSCSKVFRNIHVESKYIFNFKNIINGLQYVFFFMYGP